MKMIVRALIAMIVVGTNTVDLSALPILEVEKTSLESTGKGADQWGNFVCLGLQLNGQFLWTAEVSNTYTPVWNDWQVTAGPYPAPPTGNWIGIGPFTTLTTTAADGVWTDKMMAYGNNGASPPPTSAFFFDRIISHPNSTFPIERTSYWMPIIPDTSGAIWLCLISFMGIALARRNSS